MATIILAIFIAAANLIAAVSLASGVLIASGVIHEASRADRLFGLFITLASGGLFAAGFLFY